MSYPVKFLFILLFFFNFTNLSFGKDNIAYLNLDYLLSNSNSGISLLSQLDKIEKKNINNLESKQNELKKEENEIIKIKDIISKNELEKKIQELQVKLKAYNTLRSQSIKNFNNKKKMEILRYMNMINPIIQKYMNDQSIDILLDKKNIFIAKDSYDITQKIINLTNKEIKDFIIK